MMANCNALTEKWKWGVQIIPSSIADDAFACLLKNEEILMHEEDAKGKQQFLKRQFGENYICWKVICVLKQKPGCLTFLVREIFRCLGLCSQTLETDALRLHWGCSSGCGLICGDSLGKQFQNLAVYWKLFCLFTINLSTLSLMQFLAGRKVPLTGDSDILKLWFIQAWSLYSQYG